MIKFCGGGANWFSITDAFARYVLSSWNYYKKLFYFTQNSDELFLQTILMNSKFSENIYKADNSCESNSRYVDWSRGNPYTFTIDDYELLMDTECMFARKFDTKIDGKLVDKVYSQVKQLS